MVPRVGLTDEHEDGRTDPARAQGINTGEASVRCLLESIDPSVRTRDVSMLSGQGRERYTDLLDHLAQ